MRIWCSVYALHDIEPKRTFPDTMHMAVRVFDRLLNNVVQELEDKAAKLKQKAAANVPANGIYMRKLIRLVHECGVPFFVHETENYI